MRCSLLLTGLAAAMSCLLSFVPGWRNAGIHASSIVICEMDV